jgi:hypothetical protein
MTESTSFMAGWLRGFFDGEGSISYRKTSNGTKHTTYCLSVTNTDFALMDICQLYLETLGIEFGEWKIRVKPNRKPIRTLHVARAADVLRFAQLVGFGAPAKAARLAEAVAWINREPVDEQRAPEVIRLWKEGHSLRCIDKQLGLKTGHHNRLGAVLRSHGINVTKYGKGRKRCKCLA